MEPIAVGTSVEGRPIHAYLPVGSQRGPVLILGGFHGDEPKSVHLTRKLIEFLDDIPQAGDEVSRAIVPIVNPDGYARRTRRNARRVDINRNFPTKDWIRQPKRSRMFGGTAPGSEPETEAVMRVVELVQPARIVTIHSISGQRQCNNYDGPGRAVAIRMQRINGYPVTTSVGYPTPGSFGAWAGRELQIPTITLELPSHHSPKRCWEDNRLALLIGS